MSLLSHHREDAYRSLPTTPYPIDRSMMTGRDIEEALHHARIGAEGDYFAGTPRYGSALRSRSPFTGFDPERDGGGYHEMCMQDLIRR